MSLLNVEKLEATISTLLQHVSTQRHDLLKLVNKVTALETEKSHTITREKQYEHLSSRMENLSKDQKIYGQSLNEMQRKVFRLISIVEEKWNTRTGELLFASLQEKMNIEMNAFRTDLRAFDCLQYLQNGQEVFQKELHVLQTSMATKIDMSQFIHLESIYAQLETSLDTSRLYHEKVNDLELKMNIASEEMELHATVSLKSSHEMKKLRNSLHSKASRVELQTALEPSTTSTKRSEKENKVMYMIQEYPNMIKTMNKFQKEMKNLQIETQIQAREQARRVQMQLQEKSNIVECKETWRAVQMELGRKAWTSDLMQLTTQMDAVQKETKDIETAVSLCNRFITWFSNRGDAYEHNFTMIEAHMKTLHMPNENQPFDPFVRKV